jgi:hypothetical protein
MIGLLIIMIVFAIVGAGALTTGVDSRELDVNSYLS